MKFHFHQFVVLLYSLWASTNAQGKFPYKQREPAIDMFRGLNISLTYLGVWTMFIEHPSP